MTTDEWNPHAIAEGDLCRMANDEKQTPLRIVYIGQDGRGAGILSLDGTIGGTVALRDLVVIERANGASWPEP